MNSEKPFKIYQPTPLYQPNDNVDTASPYQFPDPFLAFSTDNSHFAEPGASSL